MPFEVLWVSRTWLRQMSNESYKKIRQESNVLLSLETRSGKAVRFELTSLKMKTLAAIVVAACLAVVHSEPHQHYGRQTSGGSSTTGTGSFYPNYWLYSMENSLESPYSREFYDVDSAIKYYGEDNLAQFFGGDKQRMRDHLSRGHSLEIYGNSLEDLFYHRPQQQGGRYKRQSVNNALDLAGSHTDRHGNDRKPFKLHGRVDAFGSGNNLRNYNVHAGAGLGSVLWRSKDRRHSVGAGVYGSQSRGSYRGHRYQSRPDFGGGLSYKFKF